MNKMDEYYKKQLSDYKPAEDGWNEPSEHLWENAQAHLPKPKKKNGIVFLSLLLVLLSALSYQFINNISENQELFSTAESPNYAKESNDSNEKYTSDLSTQPIESKLDDDKNNKLKTGANQKSNTASNSINIPSTIKPDVISSSEKLYKPNESSAELSHANNESNKVSITESKYKTDKLISFESKSKINLSSPLAPSRSRSKFNLIETLVQKEAFLLEYQSKEKNLNTLLEPVIPKPIRSRHEIGIGSTLHLLTVLGKVENDGDKDWPDEEIHLKSYNNFNLNLHYSYFFSKNWSISTGLSYHNLNFNLFGKAYEILTQSDVNDFIDNNINDQLYDGLSGNNQSDQFRIELIQGQTLNAGDTLKIGLDLSINDKIIQLPILINRKWDIKRTELFVGVGASVSLHSLKLNSGNIELFKDDQLISKPFNENESSPERIISYNVFFQTGVNYKINKRLKIGLATRIAIPEIITSGLEARLLYSI